MRIALFSATLLASSAALSAVAIDGLYSSVFGGYTYIPPNISISRFHIIPHFLLNRSHAIYQNGYNVGGRFGYQSDPLRYEGELTYIHATLKKFKINHFRQLGISGQTSAAVGMANVYYDFPDMVPAISPFLGIGLGYAWVEGVLNSRGPFFSSRYQASGGVFAYQATGGYTYNFSECYAFNIAYRYIGTARVRNLGKVFQAHNISVGAIYRFDEGTYK